MTYAMIQLIIRSKTSLASRKSETTKLEESVALPLSKMVRPTATPKMIAKMTTYSEGGGSDNVACISASTTNIGMLKQG
jgi:hypothetical protein